MVVVELILTITVQLLVVVVLEEVEMVQEEIAKMLILELQTPAEAVVVVVILKEMVALEALE